jgi:hypothetical protein
VMALAGGAYKVDEEGRSASYDAADGHGGRPGALVATEAAGSCAVTERAVGS